MTDTTRGAVWASVTAVVVYVIASVFSTRTLLILMVTFDIERMALKPFWLLGAGLVLVALLTWFSIRRLSAPRAMWLGALATSAWFFGTLVSHWVSTWGRGFGDIGWAAALVTSLKNPESGQLSLTLSILFGYPLMVGLTAWFASASSGTETGPESE